MSPRKLTGLAPDERAPLPLLRPPTSHSSVDELRGAIAAVLDAHPDLSILGWHGDPDSPFDHPRRYARPGSQAERYRHAPTPAERERIDLERARTALRFIEEMARPRKTFNTKIGSYGLKHRAEGWGHDNGMESYVANGEFIVAAIIAGFRYRRWGTSPNCSFNIGLKERPTTFLDRSSFRRGAQ